MPRTITERHSFSRADLDRIISTHAMMSIVGGLYIGDLGPQVVTWNDDGSATVETTHTPADSPSLGGNFVNR